MGNALIVRRGIANTPEKVAYQELSGLSSTSELIVTEIGFEANVFYIHGEGGASDGTVSYVKWEKDVGTYVRASGYPEGYTNNVAVTIGSGGFTVLLPSPYFFKGGYLVVACQEEV